MTFLQAFYDNHQLFLERWCLETKHTNVECQGNDTIFAKFESLLFSFQLHLLQAISWRIL
jgi:hypothetical protein